MKTFPLLVILSFFCIANAAAQPNVYGFELPGIDTGAISLKNYQGKKILIVNTSTGANSTQQYAELKQLYNMYKDSGLVIIAISSNSFNTEPRSNAEIKQFCNANYNIKFPMAAKAQVHGNGNIPLYKWLTRKEKNGIMDSEVKGDFQKYLINTEGKLVGVFTTRVTPMHEIMINAIRNAK